MMERDDRPDIDQGEEIDPDVAIGGLAGAGPEASASARHPASLWRVPNEERFIRNLVEINLRTVRGLQPPARRGPHVKHHGLATATFKVSDDPNIPVAVRKGVFAVSGAQFETRIRFSSSRATDDRTGDVHGMAIKLLNVRGTKLIEGREGETTQDFVLMDNETFPTGDPAAYELVMRLQRGQNLLRRLVSLLKLRLFHRDVWQRLQTVLARRVASPLENAYFSTTPYALGDQLVVKYAAIPRAPAREAVADSSYGLAEALEETLIAADSPVIFDFFVDVQTSEVDQPIDRPEIAWSKSGSTRHRLAEILIEPQEVNRYGAIVENISFSPWHALEAHEPLGYINRARKPVYQQMAAFRHAENRLQPTESSQIEPDYEAGKVPGFSDLYWAPPPLAKGPVARLKRRLKPLAMKILDEFPRVVKVISKFPPIVSWINRETINAVTSSTPQRPLPLSLWTSDALPDTDEPPEHKPYVAFVSWPSLVDRTFTGRHLPPMDERETQALPDIERVVPLFLRAKEKTKAPDGTEVEREIFKESDNTTVLFCFFAQWLSDSFLRTHPIDQRLNTSNHELDLCQIYGLDQDSTVHLRDEATGLLKSRRTDKGEMPALLVEIASPYEVKPEFADICYDPALAARYRSRPPHGYARGLRAMLVRHGHEWAVTDDRWRTFYAAGLERGNSTIVYSSLNALFLREHNRIVRMLSQRYPGSRPDWRFETARNITMVKYLKILIEDYINHLYNSYFKIQFPQGFADTCRWYRTNRIAIEFNLLYRWHALTPPTFAVGGQELGQLDYRFNNQIVEDHGIEAILDAASRQKAGWIELHNTPAFLDKVEISSLTLSRKFRLASFNKYKRRWGQKPYDNFLDLVGVNLARTPAETAYKVALAAELAKVYPDLDGVRGIDRVEFPVGLFAEGRTKYGIVPPLLGLMVASDAFSQALTNPLLAAYVFGNDCFTELGAEEIASATTLQDIVDANCRRIVRGDGSFGKPRASFAFDSARPALR